MQNSNKKKSISLAVFIDALGWEILQEHTFLDETLTIKKPLETIFGYSATCDPTILTGQLPRDHGHFSFFAYDPQNSPFKRSLFLQLMRLVPRQLSGRNRVRSIASRILKRKLKYTGYFNIYNMPFKIMHYFDYTEKRDLYQKDGINSGSSTIMDYAREKKIDFFLSDWRAPEEKNLQDLTDIISDPRRNCCFAYLYMAAMDATLHQYGKSHSEVSKKMAWYEQQLQKLFDTAEKQYDEVRIFLFSDHGMTNIHTVCDLMPYIQNSGLVFGKDYAAVYDSTMARFWFLRNKEATEQKIRTILDGVSGGAVMTDDQVHSWGVDFPDKRYGDLFFLLDPGVLLIPSHMGERPLAGMHGYTPEDCDSAASFSTNIDLEKMPERLDDLYHLMKREIDRCL